MPKLTQQTPQVEAHATFQHNGMTYREQASTANDARMFTLSGIAAPVRHAIMVRNSLGRCPVTGSECKCASQHSIMP